MNVSIHAPAWGATRTRSEQQSCNEGFNPRTRVGCDDQIAALGVTDTVSIHAPAWGATLQGCASSVHTTCFNPRTRVGCD